MTQTPKKSKGIAQVMEVPGKEKVTTLKEHILDELTTVNPHRQELTKGTRVESRQKDENYITGEVVESDGHTLTVKVDGTNELRHIQPNALKSSTTIARQEAPQVEADLTKSPAGLNAIGSDLAKAGKAIHDLVDKTFTVTNLPTDKIKGYEDLKVGDKLKIVKHWRNANSELLFGTDKSEYGLTQQDIKSLTGAAVKEDKMKSLKEKLIKSLKKETMYKDRKTNRTFVASDSNAERALKSAVPGAQKVPGSENVTGV